MSYLTDQLGALLFDSLRTVAPVVAEHAEEQAQAWLMQQPEGWARDGAAHRLSKVRDMHAKKALEELLQQDLAMSLRNLDHLPPEMSGATDAAKRAFDRIMGRRPNHCEIQEASFTKLASGGFLSGTARFVFREVRFYDERTGDDGETIEDWDWDEHEEHLVQATVPYVIEGT